MNSTPAEPAPDDDDASWMTGEIAATVHLAFAFDIGDEVDLDKVRLILQGQPGHLPRRRRTPGINPLPAAAHPARRRPRRHRAARRPGVFQAAAPS